MKITVEYDPDTLVDNRDAHPEIDRDATIHEYGVTLAQTLSDEFNATGVEVQPVPGLNPPSRIRVEPEPADYLAFDQLRAAIQAACEQHWERGEFWVEGEAR